MNQFDYGDYHKFMVSLGVACILAAFVMPWIFLREPFDLLVDGERLNKLTEAARAVIQQRQQMTIFIMRLVPYGSIALFLSGLVLAFRGLVQWRGLQTWMDQEQKLKVTKLEKEIQNMTPVEIKQKAEAEVAESDTVQIPEERADLPALAEILTPNQSVVSHYLKIEETFTKKLKYCLSENYDVLPKRRLGRAEFDAIAVALSDKQPDVVLEIKYARVNFGPSWQRDNISRIVLATDLYEQKTGRRAIPAIVFVCPRKLLERKKAAGYEALATKESQRLNSNVIVHFVEEEELASLTCDEIKKVFVMSET